MKDDMKSAASSNAAARAKRVWQQGSVRAEAAAAVAQAAAQQVRRTKARLKLARKAHKRAKKAARKAAKESKKAEAALRALVATSSQSSSSGRLRTSQRRSVSTESGGGTSPDPGSPGVIRSKRRVRPPRKPVAEADAFQMPPGPVGRVLPVEPLAEEDSSCGERGPEVGT
jgi:hypothetical protein